MNPESVDKVFAVVDVVTSTRLVLNCGSEQGVTVGDRFEIYGLGPMLTDPDTNEELESVRLLRGQGKVIYVQKRICTIESTAVGTRYLSPEPNPFSSVSTAFSLPSLSLSSQGRTERYIRPFDDPNRGDRAEYILPNEK